jgi:anti-sigma B factor antagonist
MEPGTSPVDPTDSERMRRAGLDVQWSHGPSGTVLHLDGDLDLATGPLLSVLSEVPAGGVVVDMGAVRFLDAAGIRALVALASTCHREGQTFSLVHVGSFQRRIIELLELSVTLGLAPSGDVS